MIKSSNRKLTVIVLNVRNMNTVIISNVRNVNTVIVSNVRNVNTSRNSKITVIISNERNVNNVIVRNTRTVNIGSNSNNFSPTSATHCKLCHHLLLTTTKIDPLPTNQLLSTNQPL